MTRYLTPAVLCLVLFAAACGVQTPNADPEAVARTSYKDPSKPTSITLMTMINNRSGEGGHSSLLINASQRVIFDPAGTWFNSRAPEWNDVLYGINPQILEFYLDYHARASWHVIMQTIEVPPEVAEAALVQAQKMGKIPKAQCAIATTRLLSNVPGFEDIRVNWSPKRTMNEFGTRAGVVSRKVSDIDSDDNSTLVAAQNS